MRAFGLMLGALVLELLTSALALAQPPASRPTLATLATQLTLPEAVQQALARNRDVNVTRRDVDVSRGKLVQARRYPFNPELAVEGEGGRGVGREQPDRRGIGGGKIGLSQVVEIRGQRGLRVLGAEADLSRATAAVRETEREVIAATAKTFGDLLVAQERVELARQAQALATRLRDTAKVLVDAGDVPELDLLRAEVEVRRAMNRLTIEETSASTVGRNLALLIGAPADVVLRASGPLLFDPMAEPLDDLFDRARSERPDLQVAEAALASTRTSLRLILAERFVPSLTLSASYADGLDFDARTRLALFGVSVPLPLWNRRDGDVRAAEAEVSKREAERERILAAIDKEVATTYRQFVGARRVVDEYVRQILPAQEQNVRLVEEGYRLGQLRLTEALLAQRDFMDTRSTYLESIAGYNTARVELQKAVGIRP